MHINMSICIYTDVYIYIYTNMCTSVFVLNLGFLFLLLRAQDFVTHGFNIKLYMSFFMFFNGF